MEAGRQEEGLIIKICGITTLEEALHSVRSGANALGFNFYRPSPRYLAPDAAARILQKVPQGVLKVAVMVVEGARALEALERIAPQVPGMDAFQLHGLKRASEVPPFTRDLLVATSPEEAPRFAGHAIVIDSSWGRGERGDWSALESLQGPFILSGGLDPENVGEAVRRLRPRGVDVCSGVERRPGVKDPERVSRFVENARAAARELRDSA